MEHEVENARKEAEKLLGFRLKPEHFAGGHLYALLPAGYVDEEEFEQVKRALQERIRALRDDEDNVEVLGQVKSSLMYYLMHHKPIDRRAFRKRLEVHLDAMLGALLKLRIVPNEQ